MFFQMRGALAEYERAKMLERTKRGMLGRARAGYPVGGQVPLGYRAIREPHKTRWEVDTDEATVVHRIFALCIRGLSVQDIARQLTQAGVFTRVDRRQDNGGRKERAPGVWEPKSVYNILTNGGYTGTVYYGKWEAVTRTTRRLRPQEEWIAIAVPAILDRATFDKAQAQLARNKRLSRRNRKHEYLLIGGRFRCGRCGRTMSGYASHDRRRYRCASVYVCDRDEGCHGAPLAEDVEDQVWRAVEAVLRQPEVISTEVQRQQAHAEDQRVTIQDACDLLDKSRGKCDREEQRWANAYAAVARLPVPTPETGADGVVQGKAVGVQLGVEAGEEVTGSLVGRQAGAAFAGDGDALVVERWVERRSHGFSSAARLGERYDQQPESFERSLAEMIEAGVASRAQVSRRRCRALGAGMPKGSSQIRLRRYRMDHPEVDIQESPE